MPDMIGTRTSSTFTVAFFRSTITAASSTSAVVDTSGEIWKAFFREDDTELPMTWLTPHQQIRPEMANKIASRLLRVFPLRLALTQS